MVFGSCKRAVSYTHLAVYKRQVKTSAYIDLQLVAREVIKKIGYTKGEYMFESNSCGVFSAIHEQSADINRGVEREDPMNQGAGDQGMMFGCLLYTSASPSSSTSRLNNLKPGVYFNRESAFSIILVPS